MSEQAQAPGRRGARRGGRMATLTVAFMLMLALASVRITSYNVCYTKLLRISAMVSSRSSSLARSSGAAVKGVPATAREKET